MKQFKSLRLLTGALLMTAGLGLVACGGEAAEDASTGEPTAEVAPVVEEPTAEVVIEEPTAEATVEGEATAEATVEGEATAEGTPVADPYAAATVDPMVTGTTTAP